MAQISNKVLDDFRLLVRLYVAQPNAQVSIRMC